MFDQLLEEKQDGHGIMCVMTPEDGDLKTTWDPDNADEVAAARNTFEKFMQKGGYAAFSVKRLGGKGEQIREFDPEAGAMILAPALAAG